ncbi:hypothetical protein LXL04_017693 [Taraxacum kok-saghyz]
MAGVGPEPVYPKVILNFRGTFLRQSRSFEGEQYLVTDMDFAACVAYLERFLGEPCEKLYYAERNKPLDIGIRWIEDDANYAFFLDTAYEEPDVPISMYIDHGGDALDDLLNTDSDESGEVTQCEEQGSTEVGDTPYITEDVLEQEIGVEPQVQPNKTDDDPFLGKLCVLGGSIDGYEGDEEGEEETEPVLGMRFEGPKQLKEMLCNYAVSNVLGFLRSNHAQRTQIIAAEASHNSSKASIKD